jgi:hypothetical protein
MNHASTPSAIPPYAICRADMAPRSAAGARLVRQHDVLGHGHDRDEHEVLVDHADAELDRAARRVDRHGPAVDDHVPLVGPVEPVEDRHERRLAGAVLAQRAWTSPGGRSKSTPSLATIRPKRFVIPRSSSAASTPAPRAS